MVFRILIVEDFEPFRRLVRDALEVRAEFCVVGEAADGLEAIQKASELQPDLVLVDIGLPKLNGIEAAKQIRLVAPQAKLLFISLESAPAMVREIFHLGAQGYIDKLRADDDLLPGVDAVLSGRRFVSGTLELTRSAADESRHNVQFYSDDEALMNTVTPFVAAPLKAGNAAIVLATQAHRDSIAQRLSTEIDLEAAIKRGRYVAVDAAHALSGMTADVAPDRDEMLQRFQAIIESAIEASREEFPRVAVYGDCADLLCAEGNTEGVICLEKTANEIIRTYNVSILCAYKLQSLRREEGGHELARICAEHTAVHFI